MRKSTRIAAPPDGFRYEEELISPSEQSDLVAQFEGLPLKEFEFHGYTGKRRVISFGWHYDFGAFSLNRTDEMPEFLFPLRERAAGFADLKPEDFPHVLITEYSPGTPIGWHRDKAVFEDVVGISLLSSCTFRLRRKTGLGWERYSLMLEPRSAYLLRDQVRNHWEHSIPAVESLRYSVTFRTLRQPGK